MVICKKTFAKKKKNYEAEFKYNRMLKDKIMTKKIKNEKKNLKLIWVSTTNSWSGLLGWAILIEKNKKA